MDVSPRQRLRIFEVSVLFALISPGLSFPNRTGYFRQFECFRAEYL